MNRLQPLLNASEIETFWEEVFPQIGMDGPHYRVEATFPGGARLRLDAGERHLRPGGTISGPAMFTLCDLACYAALIAHIGPVALAVTTNLNINFMRKPAPGSLWCDAHILKLGKSLAVIECALYSQGSRDEPVAHAVATYSIPPRDSGARKA